jgi:hypothetical protein
MELHDPCLLLLRFTCIWAAADLFWLTGDDRRDKHIDWLICRLPDLFGEGVMGGFSGNMAGPGWVVDAWPDRRPTWISIAYTYELSQNFTTQVFMVRPVTLTLRGFAL